MRPMLCALAVLVVASVPAAAGDTLKQTQLREVMPNGYRGELAAQARRDLTRLRVTRAASANTGAAHSLAQQARHLAAHGGIRSSRYGDATPRLKALTVELIRRRFRAAGWGAVARAICLARRESGLNPGAVSSTDDHGVGQIHRASYHPFNFARMDRDPAYGVWAFWIVSSHGRDWSPWSGGRYQC